MIQVSRKKQDYELVRYIFVRTKDVDRFEDFIEAIPREDVIRKISGDADNYPGFIAYLKREELLWLQMSFDVKVIKPFREPDFD